MSVSSVHRQGALFLLVVACGDGPSATKASPPVTTATPETVAGITATVNGEPVALSHGIAFSEYGTKQTLVLGDYPLGCNDAAGFFETDGRNTVLLHFTRRVQEGGAYTPELTEIGLFPESVRLDDPPSLDWAIDDAKQTLSGTLQVDQVLPASEAAQRPEQSVTLHGTLGVRYCGTTRDLKHPSRPQDDLSLQVTGNAFPITSAIVRPDGSSGARWELQLGSNPASCDSTWPDGSILVRLTYTPGGKVVHAHLSGEAMDPQLNFNVAEADATIQVQAPSEVPKSGEVDLEIAGNMEALGHRLAVDGKVSAVICPAR